MKASLYKFSLIMLMVVFSFAAEAATIPLPAKKTPTAEQAQRISEIKTRVDEIKSLDKAQLSKEERKDLSKELTEIKKESRRLSGGIYFSTGAIIVIVIVLLLVL